MIWCTMGSIWETELRGNIACSMATVRGMYGMRQKEGFYLAAAANPSSSVHRIITVKCWSILSSQILEI